jgi:hypothetical protein
MRQIRYLWLIVLQVVLTSCGPTVMTINDLKFLRKGMSAREVASTLPIQYTRTFEIDNNPLYVIHTYPLLVEKVVTGGGVGYGGAGGYSAPAPTTTFSTENSVFLIYRNERLRYWGMMGEIQKSEDVEMQQLAPRLLEFR